jgi:hypothetical protein
VTKAFHYGWLAALAIAMSLVLAPLVIFSIGIEPVDAALAYSGVHASRWLVSYGGCHRASSREVRS